jgi:hypothetical protein
MSIAPPASMFTQHSAQNEKINDNCRGSSRPIYEAAPAVYDRGLWIHGDGHQPEKVFPDSERVVSDDCSE